MVSVQIKLYLLSVALSKLTFVSTSFSDSHLTHRSAIERNLLVFNQ